MILLTRLGGPVFALNPDLVERADCTPDTVITLVDGKKYVVAESLPEVITLIRQFRATVVADAQELANGGPVALVPGANSGMDRSGPGADRVERPGFGDRAERPAFGAERVDRTDRTDRTDRSEPSDDDDEPTNVVQMHRRER